jgi:hypothetical protein
MATSNSNYASSSVTVRLAPDGKNWKDWIKQISNYAAGDNAFAILDGAACPTYDHPDERYILQTLVNPNIRDTMTPDQMQTAVTDAGKINKHLKPFNDKVRRLMKDDEERFNR